MVLALNNPLRLNTGLQWNAEMLLRKLTSISLCILDICSHVPVERLFSLLVPSNSLPQKKGWGLLPGMVPRQPEAEWRSILLWMAMKHWEQRSRNEPKENGPVVGQNFAAGADFGKTFWDAQGWWEERSQIQTWTLPSSDGQWRCGPELVRVTCGCMESLKHDEFWEEAWWFAALCNCPCINHTSH